ncbi:MAG: FprA family A-type flavoprotein [candidate division NC10 bacterium]|nr:FprA family A-type flavoprotein [candidate division NC10 bacterium]
MQPVEVIPGIQWVGVLDTQLRVFDVIMQAQHGTTYNSYLVRGRDKVALVDASKGIFAETFLDTLRPAIDPKKINYMVCNHLEPDHSGALGDVLDVAPNAQVVVTKPGKNLVRAILNRDVKPMVVGDGDRIDLGGRTLRFISAPFLHWPDTMFTYLEEDQVLFSGDFLGAHYCDPRLFNDLIVNYDEAFQYYFQVIMRPFKEYVRQALAKIESLPIKIVCPVHGPILRSDVGRYLEMYRAWSAEPPRGSKKRLLVFYVSSYGNTERMAQAIGRGIRAAGADADVLDLTKVDYRAMLDDMEAAEGIVVGTCTINGDALEHAWSLLSSMTTIKLKDKLGASFGAFGWSGEGPLMIAERMKGLKFRVPEEPMRVQLVPTEADLKSCEEYGKRLVAAL